MDLIIPANPDTGFSIDARVRTTTINGVRMVSAMDILRLVIGSRNNASEYWSRLLRDQPEVAQYYQTFKFNGPGQRDTPVVDARGTVLLINALPSTLHSTSTTTPLIVRRPISSL